MATLTKTEHPHVVRIKGVCGGEPVIKGTRTSVRVIVGYYKTGMSVEEIIEGLPHLTFSQVYDALSYYQDHQAEIEKEIQKNRLATVMNEHNLRLNNRNRLVRRNTQK